MLRSDHAIIGRRWGRGKVRKAMMLLYSLALVIAVLLSAPIWGWRMLRQGRYRNGLQQRLGAIPQRLVTWVAGRPVVWIHAVSVGETLAAARLVAELETALPGYAVIVSTTTPTGQRVARERFGVDRVFFYPIDFAFAVRPYLRALRPHLVVLMESELWPRMLIECERANIPVAVVNARVSDRSLPRYIALRALWKPLLRRVQLLLAQSDEDARRWRQIGAPKERIITAGNLKCDIQIPAETPLTVLIRKHLPKGTGVLVCGSTHAGEEELLLNCWRTMLAHAQPLERVMILAPRHPERTETVLALARERGLATLRLSHWRVSASPIASDTVLVVDTMGELASLYALATAAFVGGSLINHGGQNPLEPAQFGVPIMIGPSYENFREIVEGMLRADAIHIVTMEDICHAMQALMHTHDGSGARWRAFAASATGATARTVHALVALLQERTS
jgi:3-deoxy-D-manno-octulosonic-acid transferase